MKLPLQRFFLAFVCSFTSFACFAQNNFFSDAPEAALRSATQKRVIVPGKYRTLRMDATAVVSFLTGVPAENKLFSRAATPIMSIPMPDGSTARFHIWESSVLAPELAAANRGIHTFTGQGIDDPAATIKLDWTEFGFHAMILSPTTGAVYIDPYDQRTTTNYLSYYKKDYKKDIRFVEQRPIRFPGNAKRPLGDNVLAGVCIGSQLRTYRLALACTHEYAIAATGLDTPTKAQALAKIVVTINRVNGVYEKEVDIRMVLVANENNVIFTTAATDPFTGNDNANVLINESQSVIDEKIGSANYDIGHTFSTGGGGLAGLGVACVAGQKGSGITGAPNPVGDAYDIDFVAHEMGHQFGASHTFNSTSDNCSGNAEPTSNAEPGSGSTIMAYAGICGIDDLQLNSDAYFHAISLNEITAYTISGNGSGCAAVSSTGNIPPVVNAGSDYVIPRSTPFSLSGSATDANGDALTYCWEQVNVGGDFGAWDAPSGNAPIFRSFPPRSTPIRYFPRTADVIGNTTTKGELLPSYGRSLHFRLTARDNRSGGGGVCFDENVVTVADNAGPFVVTYPNASGITWVVNDFQTITWDPAGTGASPISCANVRIELSTDGGQNFPITILASTPNDGSEEIQVPNNISGAARIRITGVGNVFYDISNANFAIQASPSAQFAFNNPVVMATCGASSSAATLKTASLAGFNTAINLTAAGNPAGTNVTFSSSLVNPGSNTTVTLNNTNTLANGTYKVTVTGVAGSVTKTRVISFEVNAIPVVPGGLSSPANGATGVSTLPSFNWTPVSGASFYTLQISTNSSFTAIAQTINNITTLPWVLTSPLTENTVYYWRVIASNNCGTSAASVTSIFKTGIPTCKKSTDVPKAIPETGTPTITSTINIPAAAGVNITDLNVVGLTGTHSYINDITVSLTSPAGTTVVLFDGICAGGGEALSLNLDDEATAAIPCPPSGNVNAKPQNPLSAFDGQNSAGTWTLSITDNADQDGGTLTGWGLNFNSCAVIATPISTQLCPPMSGTSLTADVTGNSYQWQVNTGSGFVNISNNANYSGANTATLQISNAPSSWNGYQFRAVVDGANGAAVTIGFTNFWRGTVSSAWETAANWSCNTVPDANTDVIINSGTVVVSSNASCRSINASTGASVTVKTNAKLSITH